MLKTDTVKKISVVLLCLGGGAAITVALYLLWLALWALVRAILDPAVAWWAKLGGFALVLLALGLIVGARYISREAADAEEEQRARERSEPEGFQEFPELHYPGAAVKLDSRARWRDRSPKGRRR